MYAHATLHWMSASTAKSTRLCKKKCTSMLPTAASGRISRGNETFFTRPGVRRPPTRQAAERPVEKRFHTSRPDSKKIGNAGTPEPRIFTNAM